VDIKAAKRSPCLAGNDEPPLMTLARFFDAADHRVSFPLSAQAKVLPRRLDTK
jgi:hypothetical protein